MKNEEELKWYQLVAATIKKHPDWIGTTNHALTDGIESRLQDEIDARANAETALVIAFDNLKNIPAHQLPIVKNAIKNSKCFAGTSYANSL